MKVIPEEFEDTKGTIRNASCALNFISTLLFLIPKRWSEAVNQRRTDNVIVKRKMTKRQTTKHHT